MLLQRFLFSLAVVLLTGLSSHAALANTEPRLALLIGNASYKSSPLLNPVNDVRLMESALKEAGFQVIKAENASIRDMRRLVRDFGDRLKASGGVGLFYFAGHGVQVRGENFLVSTDSDIRNEDEVADDSINANTILEKMQSAGNRMNLVILDACRNNPFAVKSRSAQSGLATMNAPSGSLVAYSTAPGSIASDGKGKNGLYTEYLAKVIRQPGLSVEEVFKQVRTAVRRDSNFQQTPWENTALEGQFFFKESETVASAPRLTEPAAARPTNFDPVSLDLAFWESVKTSQRPAELQAYLTRFPDGVFAVLAKARIEEMRTAQTPTQGQKLAAVAPTPVPVPKPTISPAIASMPGKTGGFEPSVGGALGTLVLTDSLYGTKRSIDVSVTEKSAERTIYSSGDIVAKDGRVLQVRIGDALLLLVSGTFWSVPLKKGMSGEAAVELAGQTNSSGSITWKVISVGAATFRVDAKVNYSFGNIHRYGNWTATYVGAQQVPQTSSSVVRGQAGQPSQNNIVSTELMPR